MGGLPFTSSSQPFSFRSNGGGLNSTASPLALQENESSDLQNIDFDKFGAFKKRNGYTALNTSAFNSSAAWNGLHWFELSTGTDYLVGTCGNKIAKMDDLDGTWDDITGSLTITAGNNNHTVFRTFLDTVIATNNVDLPWKWTGSGNAAALTLPTNMTDVKFLEVFQSYTILANVTISGTAHPTRVYWSTINTIETWTDTDFNTVARNDGQDITGLRVLGEELIIFKERSIYKAVFTGDRDIPFVFFKTRSPVGCVSGHSIQEVENGLIFLATDGYYFFDGNNSFKISDRITTTLDTFNANRFPNCVSAYQRTKNRYWGAFTISGGTTHARVVTWDSFNVAFSYYKGHNPNCFAIVHTSGQERVYFGDYSGYVYRADTGTDDYPANAVTAIDAYYYTRWFDYDDLVNQKATPHVYVYYNYNNATLNFSYAYDFDNADTYSQSFSTSAGGSVYGSAVYGTGVYSAGGGAIKRRDLTGRGRSVRFKFANGTASETFQINGFGAMPHLETHV